jgi:hypothetical protein
VVHHRADQPNYNPDDCYYMNCKATTYGGVADWSMRPADHRCGGGRGPTGRQHPRGVPQPAPRLDWHPTRAPENISVDNPLNSGTTA